jgi:serine/threonine-protein kinase
MYATTNTHPAPPSTHNPASPRMLDLILEKALAKDLDRRYQSIRELCNDLRDVRRLLTGATGARPLVPLDALAPKAPVSGIATGPITGHQRTFETDEEAGRPLKAAKEFDSFSATVKLAALTQQTGEFRDYITQTQKMRAYTGAPSPAAPVAAPPSVSIPRGDITGGHRGPSPVAPRSPWMPILLLGGLALVAIVLLVALLR